MNDVSSFEKDDCKGMKSLIKTISCWKWRRPSLAAWPGLPVTFESRQHCMHSTVGGIVVVSFRQISEYVVVSRKKRWRIIVISQLKIPLLTYYVYESIILKNSHLKTKYTHFVSRWSKGDFNTTEFEYFLSWRWIVDVSSQ